MKATPALLEMIEAAEAEGRIIHSKAANANALASSLASISAPAEGCSEEKFRGWIKKVAARYGFDAHHHHYDSRRSAPGFPDDVFGREWGELRVVYIEAKVAPNKPTKAQLDWLRILDAAGGGTAASLFYPDQWAEVVELFRRK